MTSDLEYITSERFIHDQIVGECEGMLQQIWPLWLPQTRLPPVVVAWPGEVVLDDKGIPMTGKITLKLEKGVVLTKQTLSTFLQRTKAYAFLVFEDTPEGMIGVVESMHGSRMWSRPVIRSGDTKILGKLRSAENETPWGLLWRIKS